MSVFRNTGVIAFVLFMFLVRGEAAHAIIEPPTAEASRVDCETIVNNPIFRQTVANYSTINPTECAAYKDLLARFDATGTPNGITMLSPAFAKKLDDMLNAAAAAGFRITIHSGYRTVERETEISPVAFGGVRRSMHTQGLAVDLNYPDAPGSSKTACDPPGSANAPASYKWVFQHAASYSMNLYNNLHPYLAGECNHVESTRRMPIDPPLPTRVIPTPTVYPVFEQQSGGNSMMQMMMQQMMMQQMMSAFNTQRNLSSQISAQPYQQPFTAPLPSIPPQTTLPTTQTNTNSNNNVNNSLNSSSDNSTQSTARGCALDFKTCPDGSLVGRVGTACVFPTCPTGTTTTLEQDHSPTLPSYSVPTTSSTWHTPTYSIGVSSSSETTAATRTTANIGIASSSTADTRVAIRTLTADFLSAMNTLLNTLLSLFQ